MLHEGVTLSALSKRQPPKDSEYTHRGNNHKSEVVTNTGLCRVRTIPGQGKVVLNLGVILLITSNIRTSGKDENTVLAKYKNKRVVTLG